MSILLFMYILSLLQYTQALSFSKRQSKQVLITASEVSFKIEYFDLQLQGMKSTVI